MTLERLTEGSSTPETIASAVTDLNGRVMRFGQPTLDVAPGTYRLVFATADYFARTGRRSLYPKVVIEFSIDMGNEHFHIPLLISPYGYSTYRGS